MCGRLPNWQVDEEGEPGEYQTEFLWDIVSRWAVGGSSDTPLLVLRYTTDDGDEETINIQMPEVRAKYFA